MEPAPKATDWTLVLGGDDLDKWKADALRKGELGNPLRRQMRQVAALLEKHGALYYATPEVLRDIPHAALWYPSLSWLSLKTLDNLAPESRRYGMTRKPKGLVEALLNGRQVKDSELRSFCSWMSMYVDQVLPVSERTPEDAFGNVMGTLGGRIIGQGQNIGGEVAVSMLRNSIVSLLLSEGRSVEGRVGKGWTPVSSAGDLLPYRTMRCSHVLFEFLGGGSFPDLRVSRHSKVVSVSEIKGRKDKSNAWESWLPQIHAHLKTWKKEYSGAERVVFGTLFTEAMLTGKTKKATPREGLMAMHESGLLHGVYNLSRLRDADPLATSVFRDWVLNLF